MPVEYEWGWAVFGVVYRSDGRPVYPFLVRTNYRPSWWKRLLMKFLIGSTWEKLT